MSGDFIDRWRDPAEPSWVFEPTTEWQPQFPGQRYPGDIGLRQPPPPPRGRAAVGRAEVQPVSPAPDAGPVSPAPGGRDGTYPWHDRAPDDRDLRSWDDGYRSPAADHDPYRRPAEQDPHRWHGDRDAYRRPVADHDPYRRPAADERRVPRNGHDPYRRVMPDEPDRYRPRPTADDHAPYRRSAPDEPSPRRSAPDEHAPYRRPVPDERGPARHGWDERGPAEPYPPRHPTYEQPDRHDRRAPGWTPERDPVAGRHGDRYEQRRPAEAGRRPDPAETIPVSPAARDEAGWLPEPDEYPSRPNGDRPALSGPGWPERRRPTLDRDGRPDPGRDGWSTPPGTGSGHPADRLARQHDRPDADAPLRPAGDAPRHPGDRGAPRHREGQPHRDGRDVAAARAEEHREPTVRPAPSHDGALPWPQPGPLRPDVGRNTGRPGEPPRVGGRPAVVDGSVPRPDGRIRPEPRHTDAARSDPRRPERPADGRGDEWSVGERFGLRPPVDRAGPPPTEDIAAAGPRFVPPP
ncbi:LOW QUALITY PROTEIN: conserved hypothetical protein, partial [Micromonospora sp. ATCC 39149]